MERWSFAETILIRSAAFLQLGVALIGFVAPHRFFDPWGLPIREPATFFRCILLVYATLGLALLRSLSNRERSRLLVETTGLIKLSLFAMVVVDAMLRRLPMQVALVGLMDLIFGAALFRIARK